MKLAHLDHNSVDLTRIPQEITERDLEIYRTVTSTDLSQEQLEHIASPQNVYPIQTEVISVHWHPEFVPMETIVTRVNHMFPNKQDELLIPTQHNMIMHLNGFSGVEVDCYSPEFNRKVQLLLHFTEENTRNAHTLKQMLAHTFKYRQSQLYEYIDLIIDSYNEEQLSEAAGETGIEEDLLEFIRIQTRKLKTMIEENYSDTPLESLRNKLLRNYFEELRNDYDGIWIDRIQHFLKAVKNIVKKNFSPANFYNTNEIIEEARSLNAGIVIPHPEQFWPILLADYDVDGYEVWNPQSYKYTDFLIHVVHRHNNARRYRDRPLLVFMGDDCHMGEKLKDYEKRDSEKAAREIGYQPPWDDLTVRKSLIMAGFNRQSVMDEYRARLAG